MPSQPHHPSYACAIGALAAAREMELSSQLVVSRRAARDATVEDVLAADGYLFCAPENLASVSGEMKEFFDRSYCAPRPSDPAPGAPGAPDTVWKAAEIQPLTLNSKCLPPQIQPSLPLPMAPAAPASSLRRDTPRRRCCSAGRTGSRSQPGRTDKARPGR